MWIDLLEHTVFLLTSMAKTHVKYKHDMNNMKHMKTTQKNETYDKHETHESHMKSIKHVINTKHMKTTWKNLKAQESHMKKHEPYENHEAHENHESTWKPWSIHWSICKNMKTHENTRGGTSRVRGGIPRSWIFGIVSSRQVAAFSGSSSGRPPMTLQMTRFPSTRKAREADFF